MVTFSRLTCALVLAGMLAGGGWSEQDNVESLAGVDSRIDKLIEEEASIAVMMLHEENRRLKEEIAGLGEVIAGLERRLAEAEAGLDIAKAGSAAAETVKRAPLANISLKDLDHLQVLDVNRQMKVAVVNGGLRAGMKIGMAFSVVRGKDVIADVQLVDVRERIAGGTIERVVDGRFPEAGDRLVLRQNED